MISFRLFGGGAQKNEALVGEEGSLKTALSSDPPLEKQKQEPFKQYLTLDGTTSGSNDMGVDGSVTPVDFFVRSSITNDRYIKKLSIIVGYASSGKPYLWGDGAALTNGSRLFYINDTGEHNIDDSIKTNTQLLRVSGIPIVPDNWEVRHVGGLNDYGYIININLVSFSHSQGVKLDRGSNQKLIMCIRDDATAATTFDAQAIGYDRF